MGGDPTEPWTVDGCDTDSYNSDTYSILILRLLKMTLMYYEL